MSSISVTSTGFPPEIVNALNQLVQPPPSLGTIVRTVYAEDDALNVYVDCNAGNDSNDGLTAETAFQTIAQVYRSIASSATGGARIIVNLAGPASGNTPCQYPVHELIFAGHAFRGPEMVLAPVTQGAALDNPSPATAETNRTRLNFTAAAPGWGVNVLRGYFVRIKRNGALQFPEMPIAQNDSDQIWVNTASLAADVLSTDTVEIVLPGANIVGTNTDLGLPVLTFSGTSNTSFGQYCSVERVGLGDFASFVASNMIQFDRVRAETPNVGITSGTFSFVNTVIVGSLEVVGSVWNESVVSRQNYAVGKFVDLLVCNGGLYLGGPLGAGSFVANYDVSVYGNPSGSGISCRYPGSYWNSRGPNCTIQGSDNSLVGIWAYRGARVRVNSTASKTSITGTGGDLKVGQGAASSYGTGVGQFSEALGWNGNFTRILEGTATAPGGDTSQIENVF